MLSGFLASPLTSTFPFLPLPRHTSNYRLYPKEDKDERKLIYVCKSARCEHTEGTTDPYVFRNQVVKTRT